MIRSKGWLVCGLLLSSLLLAACAGPMTQSESLPGTTSASLDVVTPEPTATATIPNTPTVAPSPSPIVTVEPTPEPSLTPEPTPTPAPTATITVAVGMQNEAGQWWDGENWQERQQAGPYVFDGSSLSYINGDVEAEIGVPAEMVQLIREGRLGLGDFQQIVGNDSSVMRGYDSDENEWRVFYYENPELEGVVYAGALKFSYDYGKVVEVEQQPLKGSVVFSSQVVGPEQNVWNLDYGATLITLRNFQVNSLIPGSAAGVFNGESFDIPSLLVKVQFLHPDSLELVNVTFRNLDWMHAPRQFTSDQVEDIAANLSGTRETLITMENGLSRDEMLVVFDQLIGNERSFKDDFLLSHPQIWWALFPKEDRYTSPEEVTDALLSGGYMPYSGVNFRSVQ